jgi:aspartate racemase
MKENTIKSNGSISRRETITLLFSASLFSMPLLNRFGSNTATLSNNKQFNKMKQAVNNNPSAMKTIGILGGLGPQATMDLEMRMHKTAQALIPPMQNGGYPPMIVQYYRHPPVLLTAEHKPVFPWQPDPRLLDAAKNLGAMTDFLLIPSNGVHLFQKEIEKASGRKVISMIDTTLEEVKKRGWQKVGVLGFMNAGVYTNQVKYPGIVFETIDDTLQGKLNGAIFRVMEGREDEQDRAIALEAINELRNKKVDGIIPGCTEIPFLLGKNMDAGDLLNPAQLLAESAVKYSLA